MSLLFIRTEEQAKILEEWKLTRPKIIQDMIEKFPSNILYRLKETNQNVTIYSYSEDGTLTVNVLPQYNPHKLDNAGFIALPEGWQVFGIKQDSLEESNFIIKQKGFTNE